MKNLACVIACLLVGVSGVAAASVTPEKATEMLAHAWMVDNRCNVLDKAERDQLTDLVARAEISLAEMKSVKAATSAISKGRATGTAVKCDSKSADVVRQTLAAATSAAAISDVTVEAAAEPEPAPAVTNPPKPAAIAEQMTAEPAPEALASAQAPKPVEVPSRLRKPPETAQVSTVKLRKPKPVVAAKFKPKPVRQTVKREQPITLAAATKRPALATGYGQTAEKYYRELRCRKLSSRAVNAMYAKVLREHRRAVAADGKAAVRQILRSAASRASSGAC